MPRAITRTVLASAAVALGLAGLALADERGYLRACAQPFARGQLTTLCTQDANDCVVAASPACRDLVR